MLYLPDSDYNNEVSGQAEIVLKHSEIRIRFNIDSEESKDCDMNVGGLEAKVKGSPFDLFINLLKDNFEDEIKAKIPSKIKALDWN